MTTSNLTIGNRRYTYTITEKTENDRAKMLEARTPENRRNAERRLLRTFKAQGAGFMFVA